MRRALVIEDNIDIAIFLSNTLKKLKFNVFISQNGQLAIDYLNEQKANFPDQKIDLIILDLIMPVLNGEEFLTLANDLIQDSKILITSAKDDTSTINSCMKNGAYDYLIKPIDKDVFVDKIKDFFSENGGEEYATIEARFPIYFEHNEEFQGMIYKLSENKFQFICNQKFEMQDVMDFICEDLAAITGIKSNFYGRIIEEEIKGRFFSYTAKLVGVKDSALMKIRSLTQQGKSVSYKGNEDEENEAD